MGLADRDYMRDRERATAKRPARRFQVVKESSASKTLSFVLIWGLIFYVLLKQASWWDTHRVSPSRRVTMEQVQRIVVPSTAGLPTQETSSRQPTGAYASPHSQVGSQQTVVTKCVTKNGTSYSDGPCQAGAGSTTITTTVTRSEVAVSNGPQSLPERQATDLEPRLDAVSNGPGAVQNVASADGGRLTTCKLIDAELRKLEALARQPQSGPMQDWIRDRERAEKGRKFDLKC